MKVVQKQPINRVLFGAETNKRKRQQSEDEEEGNSLSAFVTIKKFPSSSPFRDVVKVGSNSNSLSPKTLVRFVERPNSPTTPAIASPKKTTMNNNNRQQQPTTLVNTALTLTASLPMIETRSTSPVNVNPQQVIPLSLLSPSSSPSKKKQQQHHQPHAVRNTVLESRACSSTLSEIPQEQVPDTVDVTPTTKSFEPSVVSPIKIKTYKFSQIESCLKTLMHQKQQKEHDIMTLFKSSLKTFFSNKHGFYDKNQKTELYYLYPYYSKETSDKQCVDIRLQVKDGPRDVGGSIIPLASDIEILLKRSVQQCGISLLGNDLPINVTVEQGK